MRLLQLQPRSAGGWYAAAAALNRTGSRHCDLVDVERIGLGLDTLAGLVGRLQVARDRAFIATTRPSLNSVTIVTAAPGAGLRGALALDSLGHAPCLV